MNTLILGTFDGVHAGHQQLIARAEALAEGAVIACTFPQPPARYFQKTLPVLTTGREKEQLLRFYGVDKVDSRNFDASLADMEPEAYIRMLFEAWHPGVVVVGFNHRFGKNARGSCTLLHQMATDLGYRLEVVPPVTNDGGVISSTRIRGDILAGELESANGMLKREYELSGKVVPGRKLGQTLGFATANLQPPPEKALPGSGVYASFCLIRGKQYKSITNVGVNPTVSDENPVTVETHALGFSGSLYGEAITVKFVKKLREDQKFTTLENLKMQLEADRALADAFLNLYTNKNR